MRLIFRERERERETERETERQRDRERQRERNVSAINNGRISNLEPNRPKL